MSNERAATHAPNTELPTLTQHHIDALIAAKMSIPAHVSEYIKPLQELNLVTNALVSGEAKLVPTAEIEAVLEVLGRTEVLDTNNATRKAALAIGISRWLTPEDERHE